ncbi:unnamed protein product [Linum tenue]|uniref:Uncharacterized protein n=1 Tax=Linum tenue TaxID=586396 RepID=A0AAV0Q8B2_9ROSI|nr:unnamed protein product [Linum tenue]
MARKSKPRSGTPSARSASVPSPPPTIAAPSVLSSSTTSPAKPANSSSTFPHFLHEIS